MARATAVVDPGLKDPVIPHSPWGLLKLQIEDLSGDTGKDNMYKPVYQDAVDANTPKIDPTPNKLSITPAAATAAVGCRLLPLRQCESECCRTSDFRDAGCIRLYAGGDRTAV